MKLAKTILLAGALLATSYAAIAVEATTLPKVAQEPIGSANQKLSQGLVKKIDTEQGKVTVKHGPLDNLDMPAMTMVFRVSDPLMLGKLKVDDSINFRAEKINGSLTIVRLEAGS